MGKGIGGSWAQFSCRSVELFRTSRKEVSLKQCSLEDMSCNQELGDEDADVGDHGRWMRGEGPRRHSEPSSPIGDERRSVACEGRRWIRLSAERLEDVMPCQLTSGKM